MNWITNYVRPKIQALVQKREVPDDLWDKCSACGQMIFQRELEKNVNVCPHCGHHMRLNVRKRLELLFDDGKYHLIELPKTTHDPLRFRDRKRYGERLKEAQGKSKESEAVLVAHGTIGGFPVVTVAFNFEFMGGSMGVAVGEGLVAAAKLAVLQEAALLAVPASGGARMQEGVLSLMQMPRSVVAVELVKEARLPYIVLLTDPTTGGVSASFAMLGDIAIAEPGAIIGFTGRRVIQETIRETLPPGFQRAARPFAAFWGFCCFPKNRRRPAPGKKKCRPIPPPISRMGRRVPRKGPVQAAIDAIPASSKSDRVLDRLNRLHPKIIDLGLDRVVDLLRRLGDPQERVAPTVHVAGTNGKGSTIAFLRAMLDAGGQRVQCYTSPHLVRFHERIRLTSGLIDEETLVALLEYCENVSEGRPITYFEITTVAAFCAFAAENADLLLLETGLGGRLDATNVLTRPLASVITPISLDHTQFLGESLGEIAFEKAGILKSGVPAIVGPQPPEALVVIERRAGQLGAPLLRYGREWRCEETGDELVYEDATGCLRLPRPALIGAHQAENAALAVAVARHAPSLCLSRDAMARGLAEAQWPARLQRLRRGPLVTCLEATGEENWQLWLDGGHNPAAGERLADVLVAWHDRPVHLIYGMMNSKLARDYLRPLAGRVSSLHAVTIPGEANALSADAAAAAAADAGMQAVPADSVASALARILAEEAPGRILICGSLYLAGRVLAENA